MGRDGRRRKCEFKLIEPNFSEWNLMEKSTVNGNSESFGWKRKCKERLLYLNFLLSYDSVRTMYKMYISTHTDRVLLSFILRWFWHFNGLDFIQQVQKEYWDRRFAKQLCSCAYWNKSFVNQCSKCTNFHQMYVLEDSNIHHVYHFIDSMIKLQIILKWNLLNNSWNTMTIDFHCFRHCINECAYRIGIKNTRFMNGLEMSTIIMINEHQVKSKCYRMYLAFKNTLTLGFFCSYDLFYCFDMIQFKSNFQLSVDVWYVFFLARSNWIR